MICKVRAMPSKKNARSLDDDSAANRRRIETFSKRITVGTALVHVPRGLRKKAVADVAKNRGLSESYVWRTVRLATKIHSGTLAILAAQPSRNKRRPRTVASLFLLEALRKGPRAAKEIKELARNAGITPRTLRRAEQRIVKRRRIGGRHGCWVWELSTWARKTFMPPT